MLSPQRERLLLFILASVQFTHIMDFMIMMPLGPEFMRLFAISPKQFSLVVSAYTLSAGVAGLLSAFKIDRFDRQKALLRVYLGFIIGTLGCALAPNYEILVAARVFTGAFGGILSALILAIIGDAIPQERRGYAMGTVMTSFSLASVFGVPFGLLLADRFSWHAPFLFLVLIGLVIFIGILKTVPPMKGHIQRLGPTPVQVLRDIANDGNQVRALLLTAVLMLGQFTMIPFLSAYMVSNVGFRQDQLYLIYLLGGAATIFSSPLVGRLADYFGSARIFMIAAVLSTVPVWLLTHLTRTPIPIVLVLTTLFFIVGNARMVPAMALVTSTVPPQRRGGFMSINSCLQSFASGVAAMVAGSMVTKAPSGEIVGYNNVAYLTIGASLICIFIARFVIPLPLIIQKAVPPQTVTARPPL